MSEIENLINKIEERCSNLTVNKNQDFSEIDNFIFNNLNTNKIEIIHNCGCKKYKRISSLYSSKSSTCCKCKRLNKFKYDSTTGIRTCVDCGYNHENIPNSNLNKWKCFVCEESFNDKDEVILGRELIKKGYSVFKNYRYCGNYGALTGDLYFKYNNNTIIIECDENSHCTDNRKKVHLKKDKIIENDEVCDKIVIHLHSRDIHSFLENVQDILNNLKGPIFIYKPTKRTEKFYSKIYD